MPHGLRAGGILFDYFTHADSFVDWLGANTAMEPKGLPGGWKNLMDNLFKYCYTIKNKQQI